MKHIILTILLVLLSIDSWATVGGKCGENVTWKFTAEGEITISGRGAMYDFGQDCEFEYPWDDYCEDVKTIIIEDGVTRIGYLCFYGFTALTKVVIPNSVTSIGSNAFRDCRSLSEINIPSSVKEVGGDAFYNTAWYKKQPDGLIYINTILYEYKGEAPAGSTIKIKEGTTDIAQGSFGHTTCDSELIIPSTVNKIGDDAFGRYVNFKSITCYATTPPVVENYLVESGEGDSNDIILYVPKGSVEAYKATDIWNEFVIIGISAPCATPVIKYRNGKFSITCATEDAIISYDINGKGVVLYDQGEKAAEGAISIPVTIRATAKAEGYGPSEPAELTIDLKYVTDSNGDGVVTIEDITSLIDKYLNQ